MPEQSPLNLSAIELRVLGVLMEKQLTTPDQYPLTLNSVVTACNQKSSREPITQYNQGEVTRTLNELDTRHFVRRERGSRAEKFEQLFMNVLGLGRKQQALLCVMMLRGPQTISELSTRTQRMCDFVDKEELELCIDRLCDREVPYAIKIAQQPGQRGERIAHLFSGAPSIDTDRSVEPASSVTKAAPERDSDALLNPGANNTQASDVHLSQVNDTDHVKQLGTHVLELQTEVQELKQKTKKLEEQVERLYALSNNTNKTHAE